MAFTFAKLRLPLRQLEAGIDAGNPAEVIRAAGVLLEHAAGLWRHKAPVDKAGALVAEPGRGDLALEVERCISKLAGMRGDPSASGPPWDGSLLRMILEFLLTLLKPIVNPAA